MKIHFLEAPMPLTKQFSNLAGNLQKSSYPHAYEVTSHEHDVRDLKGFEAAIKKHAALGHCLVKGELTRKLVSESRAGSTDSDAVTQWVCLDIDGLPALYEQVTVEPGAAMVQGEQQVVRGAKGRFKAEAQSPAKTTTQTIKVSIDWLLDQLGLKDISYILQWSASQGIESDAFRCHIFMMLDKPHPAPMIKQWLIDLNCNVPCLVQALSLTKTGNALSWPLDVSACQNDKLIYIAPPVLKGVKDPLGKTPRISLVKRSKATLALTAIASPAKNREQMHKRLDALREIAGLPKRRTTYKMHGTMEVMNRPDVCMVTGIKEERGFVYLNLNDGDSWGYFHPESNPDYIHNFKGEPIYLTKDLLPDYWAQLHQRTNRVDTTGMMKLAFLDPKTDRYWRGTYDTLADELSLESTSSALALKHFCKVNGVPLADDVIPECNLIFDPHDNVRVDLGNNTVNTFQPSQYMRAVAKPVKAIPKTIRKIIHHVVGSDDESFNRYINWLAYVLQTRDVAITAWVFHGVPGTGKGTLLNKILRPIWGTEHVAIPRMKELEQQFNGFIEHSLLVCVDEVQIDALQNENGFMADIRRYVSEQWIPLRRMHRDATKVRNYSAWQFFSNASAPVAVPRDDRRINVAMYQPVKLELTDIEIARIEHELQAFHDYLLHYQADKDLVITPLVNQAREDMIELTETAIDSVSNALIRGDMGFFIGQLPTDQRYTGDSRMVIKVEDYKSVLQALLKRTERNSGMCSIARDELRAIYEYTVGKIPESPHKFTALIKHHRVTLGKVWLNGKTINGIKAVWQDLASWPEYLEAFTPAKPAAAPAKLARVK